MTSVVVGARNEQQLSDNLAAADLALDGGERRRLDRASVTPLAYPFWHQALHANDRLSAADRTLSDQER